MASVPRASGRVVPFPGARARWAPVADMPNVLVAMDDAPRRRMRLVLAACRITCVHTVAQLAATLAVEPFDLVLIGSRFDGDHAAAALSAAVATRPACRVVCVATAGFAPEDRHPSYAAFRSECLELGAYDTLDLARWRDDELGNGSLRTLLGSVLRET